MSVPKRSRVDVWREGISAHLSATMMAQQLAAGADQMFELMQAARKRQMDAKLPALPRLDAWLPLYYDELRVLRVVMPHGDSPAAPAEDLEGFLELAALHREDEQAAKQAIGQAIEQAVAQAGGMEAYLTQGFRLQHERYQAHLREVEATIRGEAKPSDATDIATAVEQSPEVYFFLRIALPALMLYHSWPAQIMQKAEAGSLAHIEMLARLDPLADQLPAVAKWWNVANGQTRQLNREQLLRWQQQGLDSGQFKRSSFICIMGGLILGLFKTLGTYMAIEDGRPVAKPAQVTAQQIADLFHAVANDRAGLEMGTADADIEDMQQDSWRKRVSDACKLWMPALTHYPAGAPTPGTN